jgi:hypothetical protein
MMHRVENTREGKWRRLEFRWKSEGLIVRFRLYGMLH